MTIRSLQGRIILGLWLGLLWLTTVVRADVWQSSPTLFRDGVLKAPTKPRMLVNYGEMLEETGDLEGSLQYYQRAYAAVGWRKDHRSRVSKFYAVQDMVHNIIKQGRPVDLWPVLAAAGCPLKMSVQAENGREKAVWTCPVETW